jgi:hypothetical protein
VRLRWVVGNNEGELGRAGMDWSLEGAVGERGVVREGVEAGGVKRE